jgi:hypothetical protein
MFPFFLAAMAAKRIASSLRDMKGDEGEATETTKTDPTGEVTGDPIVDLLNPEKRKKRRPQTFGMQTNVLGDPWGNQS